MDLQASAILYPSFPQVAIFLTATLSGHHNCKYHATGTLSSHSQPFLLHLCTMRDPAVNMIHNMMLNMLGRIHVYRDYSGSPEGMCNSMRNPHISLWVPINNLCLVSMELQFLWVPLSCSWRPLHLTLSFANLFSTVFRHVSSLLCTGTTSCVPLMVLAPLSFHSIFSDFLCTVLTMCYEFLCGTQCPGHPQCFGAPFNLFVVPFISNSFPNVFAVFGQMFWVQWQWRGGHLAMGLGLGHNW